MTDGEAIGQPVAFFASLPHYVEHLAPVFLSMRSRSPAAGFWTVPHLIEYVRSLGIDAVKEAAYPFDDSRRNRSLPGGPSVPALNKNPVVVASYGDLRRVRHAVNRPAIGMEHGCGLTYTGDLPQGHWMNIHIARMQFQHLGKGLGLRFVPNYVLAEREKLSYPGLPIIVLGDSPKLDSWRPCPRLSVNGRAPTICFSSHFNLTRVPETRSVIEFYKPCLPELAKRFKMIGHCHPLEWEKARQVFESVGIEPVEHFSEVIRRADVYMTSGSSTLYEFASLDRPVIALRAPFMRKDVNHGLLFWDYVPGIECWKPEDLAACVDEALRDRDEVREQRMRAVNVVYPQRDGRSAERAAEAILQWQQSYSEETTIRT